METLSKKEIFACLELGKVLVSELDPDRLFEIIINKLTELIPANNWSLLLVDYETNELCFNVCAGLNCDNLKNVRLKMGEGVAGNVALKQEAMIIEDVNKCEYFAGRIDKISGFVTTSIICVPLIFHGRTVGVLEAINPTSLEKNVTVLLGLIADYTAIAVENTRLYHKLEFMVDHDNLTGLYNTRFMYHDLIERIESYKKEERIFSLIFMDINNFKRVVENFGHLIGSRIIKEFARTVIDALKDNEYCVSYAGDEFIIVIPDTDSQSALKRTEEIDIKLNQASYLTNGNEYIKLSASFGIAAFPHDEDTLSGLLNRADMAMFKVKDKGKSRN